MSSRDMTLTELKHTSKAFNDSHTIKVSDIKGGGSNKITAAFVLKELRASNALILNEMNKRFEQVLNEMHKGFAQVNARIDNLVAKNNLKE